MKRCLWLLLIASTSLVAASDFDYGLKARQIAEGVYVFEGRREHFTRDNGGNIVNTGFIQTDAGAVVIDTGPSRRYGEQMRRAIEAITGKGIAKVFITHAHPDHFLGNQAFDPENIAAASQTVSTISQAGEDLSENLYRLVGGWMQGTEAVAPVKVVEGGVIDIGGRTFHLIVDTGHTASDLAVFDQQTGTLFAGDLVFLDRAATTPNADVERWLEALTRLEKLPVKQIVPGHGPVADAGKGIAQTRAYLNWLRNALSDAASRGLDMNEAMKINAPEAFRKLGVFDEEFQRSVIHLFPEIEEQAFGSANQ